MNTHYSGVIYYWKENIGKENVNEASLNIQSIQSTCSQAAIYLFICQEQNTVLKMYSMYDVICSQDDIQGE